MSRIFTPPSVQNTEGVSIISEWPSYVHCSTIALKVQTTTSRFAELNDWTVNNGNTDTVFLHCGHFLPFPLSCFFSAQLHAFRAAVFFLLPFFSFFFFPYVFLCIRVRMCTCQRCEVLFEKFDDARVFQVRLSSDVSFPIVSDCWNKFLIILTIIVGDLLIDRQETASLREVTTLSVTDFPRQLTAVFSIIAHHSPSKLIKTHHTPSKLIKTHHSPS